MARRPVGGLRAELQHAPKRERESCEDSKVVGASGTHGAGDWLVGGEIRKNDVHRGKGRGE